MLRSLSLAFNTLTFEQDHAVQPQLEIDFSYSFLTSFIELTQKTTNLNHLDISGMSWGIEALVKLSHGLVSCPNLSSVHLSDNGLNSNLESKLEILDIFGIDLEHLESNPRSHIKNKSVSHTNWMKKTLSKSLKMTPTMLGDIDY